jgi:hypothetical protein
MKMGTKLILKDYIIVSTVSMIIGLAGYRELVAAQLAASGGSP